MRVGLFICDHVRAESLEEFGDYPDMFARLFPSFEWQLYDVCNGEFPDDLDECDVYMATGSKHSVYEELEWITELKKVIAEIYKREKYFVGFCFGHQLIGEALGGKVGKSDNGWCVGIHEFEIIHQEKWMTPIKKKVNALMMCQDQILQLPPNSVVIAKSPQCPVGIIRVGDKILGVQGHPEYKKEYDKTLIEERVSRIGSTVVEDGINSLTGQVDSDVLAEWVRRFLG